jgi:hypothetical protein
MTNEDIEILGLLLEKYSLKEIMDIMQELISEQADELIDLQLGDAAKSKIHLAVIIEDLSKRI